jgi:hypothetical protein
MREWEKAEQEEVMRLKYEYEILQGRLAKFVPPESALAYALQRHFRAALNESDIFSFGDQFVHMASPGVVSYITPDGYVYIATSPDAVEGAPRELGRIAMSSPHDFEAKPYNFRRITPADISIGVTQATQVELEEFELMQSSALRASLFELSVDGEFCEIHMSELTLPEQFQLFRFLKTMTEDELKVFVRIISRHVRYEPVERQSVINNDNYNEHDIEQVPDYNQDVLKLFLSLEGDDTDTWRDILSAIDKADKSSTRQLLNYYIPVVTTLQNIDKALDTVIVTDSELRQRVNIYNQRLVTRMFARAQRVVERYCNAVHETDRIALLQELGSLSVEAEVFLALCHTVISHNGDIRLEDIEGVEYSVVSPEVLTQTQDDITKMRDILQRNYTQQYRVDIVERAVEEFNTHVLPGSACTWHILRQGDIFAFMRTEEIAEGVLYAGSFNVSSEARNSKLGEVFQRTTIDVMGETHRVYIECSLAHATVASYIERGFVITASSEYGEGAGWAVYNRSLINQSRAKGLSQEQLAQKEDIPPGVTITIIPTIAGLEGLVSTESDQGRMITRCFQVIDQAERVSWCVVSEPLPGDVAVRVSKPVRT